MPDVKAKEGIGLRPVQDSVFIDFAPGGVPSMEMSWRVLHVLNKNVVRKKRIKPFSEGLGGNARVGEEVADLAQRMDAGIRSSRGDQSRKLPGDDSDSLFDHPLDREFLFLSLPTMVGSPVVLEDHFDLSSEFHGGGSTNAPHLKLSGGPTGGALIGLCSSKRLWGSH